MALPTKVLRFSDLEARGIVKSRVQLGNLIRNEGFPPGRLIGKNSRAWTPEEISDWWESRPTVHRLTIEPRRQKYVPEVA